MLSSCDKLAVLISSKVNVTDTTLDSSFTIRLYSPSFFSINSNVSKNTNSIIEEVDYVFNEKFATNTKKSLSNTQLPEIPKSTTKEVWR